LFFFKLIIFGFKLKKINFFKNLSADFAIDFIFILNAKLSHFELLYLLDTKKATKFNLKKNNNNKFNTNFGKLRVLINIII